MSYLKITTHLTLLATAVAIGNAALPLAYGRVILGDPRYFSSDVPGAVVQPSAQRAITNAYINSSASLNYRGTDLANANDIPYTYGFRTGGAGGLSTTHSLGNIDPGSKVETGIAGQNQFSDANKKRDKTDTTLSAPSNHLAPTVAGGS